jgi:hypothetical protein
MQRESEGARLKDRERHEAEMEQLQSRHAEQQVWVIQRMRFFERPVVFTRDFFFT